MLARKGFTLIELSISIAVIGLLVGGIMGGRALYNGQAMRKIADNARQYMVAANQFKQKFGYMPGDFPGATGMWGNATGGAVGADCSAAAQNTTSIGTATCNGDGNGIISRITMSDATLNENWRAWQHLANAGMVKGKYSGIGYCIMPGGCSSTTAGGVYRASFGYPMNVVPDAPSNILALGTPNVPSGPVKQSQYIWYSATPDDPTTIATIYRTLTGTLNEFWLYEGNYANAIAFGAYISDGAHGAILAADAYYLDKKFDDGIPSTGAIRTGSQWNWMDCSTTPQANPDTAQYNLTSEDPYSCPLFFLQAFATQKTNSM